MTGELNRLAKIQARRMVGGRGTRARENVASPEAQCQYTSKVIEKGMGRVANEGKGKGESTEEKGAKCAFPIRGKIEFAGNHRTTSKQTERF